jgi:hypothetical protein
VQNVFFVRLHVHPIIDDDSWALASYPSLRLGLGVIRGGILATGIYYSLQILIIDIIKFLCNI